MTFIAAFDAGLTGLVYDLRLPIAVTTALLAVIVAIVAYRLGWFAAARRHPARAAALAVVVLVAALPLGFYTISPLFIRRPSSRPAPVGRRGCLAVSPVASADTSGSIQPVRAPRRRRPPATPTPTPFAPSTVATGVVPRHRRLPLRVRDRLDHRDGTRAVHLRLEDFSVRNGPDLFVYLSPDADGYTDGALELGRLKATDGSFGYELPAGTDPADFASAIIWCKQFTHLFAVAPFVAD